MAGHHYFMCSGLDADVVHLDREESKHLSKVMRLQVGDTIRVLDGRGGEGLATILEVNNEVKVQIRSRVLHPIRSSNLTLAVAPPKKADRLETMLEKCTELGVRSILLMQTQRSERRRINRQRLERIVESACKQSGNPYLPELSDLMPYSKILERSFEYDFRAICCIDHSKPQRALSSADVKNSTALVMIGPEGGFADKEIELAKQSGLVCCSLGERRLRTETAALYVAAMGYMD